MCHCPGETEGADEENGGVILGVFSEHKYRASWSRECCNTTLPLNHSNHQSHLPDNPAGNRQASFSPRDDRISPSLSTLARLLLCLPSPALRRLSTYITSLAPLVKSPVEHHSSFFNLHTTSQNGIFPPPFSFGFPRLASNPCFCCPFYCFSSILLPRSWTRYLQAGLLHQAAPHAVHDPNADNRPRKGQSTPRPLRWRQARPGSELSLLLFPLFNSNSSTTGHAMISDIFVGAASPRSKFRRWGRFARSPPISLRECGETG